MATDAGGEGGIGNRYGLGMLVGGMMLFRMDLLMLLEVLRALERLLTDLATVRLERSVDCGSVSWGLDATNKTRRYL